MTYVFIKFPTHLATAWQLYQVILQNQARRYEKQAKNR